jgi:hypothetical protein
MDYSDSYRECIDGGLVEFISDQPDKMNQA